MAKTATIIEWENILRPREGEIIHQVEAGQTLHEWLTGNVPGYSQELDRHPVECIVSGQAVAPEQWPMLVLREDTPVVLAVRPYGWETLIYAVVALAAAAVAINSMPPPPSESGLPSASPTYDVNAQNNQARLMSPIPFSVGYNRHWMDLLTEPWKEFAGNDQYLYVVLCVGWGEYDLEPLQIGETEHSHYQDIEYEVYGPGDPVTLFPDNVDTSTEVGGIELFGPNEEEHDGWSGWFIVVKKQQKANYLACDFACRQGIYGMDDKGRLHSRTASVQIDYQKIDDDDEPFGEIMSIPLDFSGATTTPQRWTERWDVSEGRYRARCKRTNNAGTDTKQQDSIHWEQVRAYLPSKQDYPGVTKIAVRARASNNLSQQSETEFNIKGTALVPEWNGSQWIENTKSRDIAWAYCNAIRSAHGGRLDDSLIDMENVLSIHQQWALAGETVSRVFDTRGTLLGALQEMVACGRGTVLTHNGRFYVVRDMQRLIRRHMYTPFMMQGAPKVDRSFVEPGDYDSIIIEYFNQAIWQNDEILCQLPNHPADNPRRITLRGVSSRDQAWRLGIFLCAKELYRRKQISFTTEMQALNSIWGDKVGISYWLRGWGQSGEVIEWDGMIATLSDDVEMHPTKQNMIALCRPDGTFAGPYRIEPASDNRVLIAETPDFDLYTGDRMQRTQYQLGTEGAFCKDFLITEISPAADGQVSVTAVSDNPKVYEFEKLPPPPDTGDGDTLPRPVKPVISNLVLVQDVLDPQSVTLSWQSTAGAREFIIEHSIDGVEYARVAVITLNTWSTKLFNGDNWFRVAGVADAQGDWEVGHIELTGPDFDVPPATTIHLSEPFTGKTLKVHWDEVLSAVHYTVEVVKNSKVLYSVKQYPDTHWEYSHEQGAAHGSGRAFTVRVTPYNAKGVPGEPAELGARNEPPAVPDNVSVTPLMDSFIITCGHNDDADIRDLRLWGSQAKGFTPDANNLLQISSSTRIDLNISGQWYFRLAWTDVWGVAEVNYTGEISGKTSDIDWDEIFPIDETQIDDDSISTPKLQANSVIAEKIAARAITAEKIAAEQIEAVHIRAKSLTGEEISSETTIIAGKENNIAGMSGNSSATRFWAGSELDDAPDSANFHVDTEGNLRAENAEISGHIEASSGTFTGRITSHSTISGSAIEGSTISGGSIDGVTINGSIITGSQVFVTEQLYLADPHNDGRTVYYKDYPEIPLGCVDSISMTVRDHDSDSNLIIPVLPAGYMNGKPDGTRLRWRDVPDGFLRFDTAIWGVQNHTFIFRIMHPGTGAVLKEESFSWRGSWTQAVYEFAGLEIVVREGVHPDLQLYGWVRGGFFGTPNGVGTDNGYLAIHRATSATIEIDNTVRW